MNNSADESRGSEGGAKVNKEEIKAIKGLFHKGVHTARVDYGEGVTPGHSTALMRLFMDWTVDEQCREQPRPQRLGAHREH
jgi:hypothetical protein